MGMSWNSRVINLEHRAAAYGRTLIGREMRIRVNPTTLFFGKVVEAAPVVVDIGTKAWVSYNITLEAPNGNRRTFERINCK